MNSHRSFLINLCPNRKKLERIVMNLPVDETRRETSASAVQDLFVQLLDVPLSECSTSHREIQTFCKLGREQQVEHLLHGTTAKVVDAYYDEMRDSELYQHNNRVPNWAPPGESLFKIPGDVEKTKRILLAHAMFVDEEIDLTRVKALFADLLNVSPSQIDSKHADVVEFSERLDAQGRLKMLLSELSAFYIDEYYNRLLDGGYVGLHTSMRGTSRQTNLTLHSTDFQSTERFQPEGSSKRIGNKLENPLLIQLQAAAKEAAEADETLFHLEASLKAKQAWSPKNKDKARVKVEIVEEEHAVEAQRRKSFMKHKVTSSLALKAMHLEMNTEVDAVLPKLHLQSLSKSDQALGGIYHEVEKDEELNLRFASIQFMVPPTMQSQVSIDQDEKAASEALIHELALALSMAQNREEDARVLALKVEMLEGALKEAEESGGKKEDEKGDDGPVKTDIKNNSISNSGISADGPESIDREAELKKVFALFDLDGSGVISSDELMCLGEARAKTGHKKREWTTEMNEAMIEKMDQGTEDGRVDSSEFVLYFMGTLKSVENADFMKTMEEFREAREHTMGEKQKKDGSADRREAIALKKDEIRSDLKWRPQMEATIRKTAEVSSELDITSDDITQTLKTTPLKAARIVVAEAQAEPQLQAHDLPPLVATKRRGMLSGFKKKALKASRDRAVKLAEEAVAAEKEARAEQVAAEEDVAKLTRKPQSKKKQLKDIEAQVQADSVVLHPVKNADAKLEGAPVGPKKKLAWQLKALKAAKKKAHVPAVEAVVSQAEKS